MDHICWIPTDGIPKMICSGTKGECIQAANGYTGQRAYVFSTQEDKIIYIKDGAT